MALAIDTSRQFRSIGELAGLVRAIAAAPTTESEPDWLEWKRGMDLTDRSRHVQMAKFIAGFANRDPIVARQNAGGCAYLVIGAEPGNVSGVIPVDNANLDAGISRFVRARWSPHYVDHEGKQVLVITVEPPDRGNRIVAMLTAYEPSARGAPAFRKGDVFLRRHGRTELAEQEDYDMLVQRFAAGAGQADGMSVEPLIPVTAVPVACGPSEVSAWRERQQRTLLASLEVDAQRRAMAALVGSYESRSPEQYRHEVTSYLAEMAPWLPHMARIEALEDREPSMRLVLINETERNFAAARVEITLSRVVWAYGEDDDSLRSLPEPPRAWGEPWRSRSLLSLPIISVPAIRSLHISNADPARIEFPDVDLRPGERVKLAPVHLVTDAALAGGTLTARWSITSKSADGIASGEIAVSVPSDVVSPLTH